MSSLLIAALFCLALALILGGIDGVYYHLKRYQLYLHAESRFEHQLHAARAFLLAPILWLLFGQNYGGWFLWLGILFFAADTVVELIDVLIENRSRAKFGGLTTGEYALHVNATALRVTGIALILAAKPATAWNLSSATALEPHHPAWLSWLVVIVAAGSLIGGIQHLWLMNQSATTRQTANS